MIFMGCLSGPFYRYGNWEGCFKNSRCSRSAAFSMNIQFDHFVKKKQGISIRILSEKTPNN